MRYLLLVLVVACNADAAAPSSPTPAAAPTPPDGGFIYEEDGDTLTFRPPVGIRFVRNGKRCDSELSTGADNMWTGPDVQAALANADVQKIVSLGKRPFVPSEDMDKSFHVGVVRIGKGAIEWTMSCRWCTPEPDGVRQLHTVLVGVMRNRRLVCPS